MATLLTGFTAFPGAPANPTERLARDWPEERGPAVVLPVDWHRTYPALVEAVRRTEARRVVLFGLAVKADRIRIERHARNFRRADKPDSRGAFCGGAVVDGGPERIDCLLPQEAVGRALAEAGIDFDWSDDAGAYLCNDTLYRLGMQARELELEAFVFVHVPLSEELAGTWRQAGALPEGVSTVPQETIRRAAAAVTEALERAGG